MGDGISQPEKVDGAAANSEVCSEFRLQLPSSPDRLKKRFSGLAGDASDEYSEAGKVAVSPAVRIQRMCFATTFIPIYQLNFQSGWEVASGKLRALAGARALVAATPGRQHTSTRPSVCRCRARLPLRPFVASGGVSVAARSPPQPPQRRVGRSRVQAIVIEGGGLDRRSLARKLGRARRGGRSRLRSDDHSRPCRADHEAAADRKDALSEIRAFRQSSARSPVKPACRPTADRHFGGSPGVRPRPCSHRIA